jgi:hypothetical protein
MEGEQLNIRDRFKIKKKSRNSTQELLGVQDITGFSLKTGHGELVYFLIKPTNVSVLSEASLTARIYALMTVLKGLAEIEMICLNSREDFEGNKRFLKSRLEKEDNPSVRRLLEQDLLYLDRIQIQTATAREFLLVIRLRDENETEVFPYLGRIEKSLMEQGFTAKRADREEIKRLLAIYFEQNVTTEKFEDTDGQRWVITGD